MSKLDPGVKDAPPPPSTKISQKDLLAYCPTVTLREGTAFYSQYAKGARKPRKNEDDPLAGADAQPDNSASRIYQAAITDVTRSCSYNGGMLTMTVAAAGKIVPGPMGKAGSVTLPIRVVVLRDGDVIYSNLAKYPVQIADSSEAAQFLYSNANVTFEAPAKRNIQVFAGFDAGPEAGKSKKK
ncbi:MAG: hypothetical protein L0I29_15140 [Hyphomicrobiales bacterium]|nr:hypothetical protein [Hyphomicrobiales bacterium]